MNTILDLDGVQPLHPDLARVDRRVRQVPANDFPRWDGASAQEWPLVGEAPCWALVRALSMHPRGQVREAAVGRMAGDLGNHLPWLSLRITDWIPAVRRRAEDAALSTLVTVPLADVIYWDQLLLSVRARHLAPRLAGAVERLLVEDPTATIGALRPDSHLAADVLLGSDAVNPAMLLRTPSAYRGVIKEGLRRTDTAELQELLSQARFRDALPLSVLAAHAWPGIDTAGVLGRRERAILHGDPLTARFHELACRGQIELARSAEQVVAALLGRTAERRSAQRLAAAAGLDVAGYYRGLLDLLPTAIVGLGEVGDASDAAAVRRYLDHGDETHRWAAVNALKLDPDGHLEDLVAALDDPSLRVARAAAWRLRRRVPLVGAERIFDIGVASRGPHAREVCSYLLTMLPADQRLVLLTRRRSGPGADRTLALESLREWRNSLDNWRRTPLPSEYQRRLTPSPAVLAQVADLVADDEEAAMLLDLSTALRRPRSRDPWGTGSPSVGAEGD